MNHGLCGMWIGLVLGLTLAGCQRQDQASAGAHAEAKAADHAAPTNRVDIPSAVRSNLGITFAKVERRQVANTLRLPGAFELEPRARREYRLALAGEVEFEVQQFDEVKPGTLLYRYRSPAWSELQHEIIEAEQKMAAVQSRIGIAQASLVETMAKHDATSARIQRLAAADFKRADLDAQLVEWRSVAVRQQAELKAEQAALVHAEQLMGHAVHRASYAVGMDQAALLESVQDQGQATRRYLTIDWIEVRATEPGIVESFFVTDGSYVEATTLLVATVDLSRVRFRAQGLQSDLAKFKPGMAARLMLPGAAAGLEARLILGLEADSDHRTVTLFATPGQPAAWARPAVSGFMEIETQSTDQPVLAIPRSAVVKDGITHVFFRRDPGDANKAIRVEADLGVDDGRWIEIKSGLGPNDEVVLEGVYELKLATSTSGTTQKGGHFHADGTFHEKHD